MGNMIPFLAFILPLFLACILLPVTDTKSDIVRICVSANPSLKSSHTVKSCDQLARSKRTPATCVFGADRLDCLRLVSERKADMTVLEAEDLRFAAATCSGTCAVLVVSEVRALNMNPYEYKAVVVVRANAHVKPDLQGTRLCHPGWNAKDGLFSQYLEDRLAPQSCNANLSLLEDRLRTSNAYFGASCKAGSWSLDRTEDARLKNTYPNLCAACDNPTDCLSSDKYWGEGGAATCLQDGSGDALWTTEADVRMYFKTNPSDFRFLCMDGTTQSLNITNPCIWMARPWQVVIANSKVAMEVQKTLLLLSIGNITDWEENLLSVFEAHKEYVVNLETSKPPEDYLETIPGYLGASDLSLTNCNPRHQVTWCTTSNVEYRKCYWIARAAAAFAVAPAILCEQRDNIPRCLESVAKMEADITVVPPDFQPEAILKHNLQALYYEDFKASDGRYSLTALTKRGLGIKSGSDLKFRRACFTLRDGLGWRAVLVYLRRQGLVSSSCSATNVIQSFFSEVCVTTGEGTIPYCCGKRSDVDPDDAAFRCLAAGGCDVAFVRNTTFFQSLGRNNTIQGLETNDFQSVCNDNKIDCSWAWAAPSAIMAAKDITKVRLEETRHVITELSRLFMRRNKSKNLVLAVFGLFHDEHNILFRDSSSDLILAERFMERKTTHDSLQDIINETKFCSNAPLVTFRLHLSAFCIFCIGLYYDLLF